MRFRQVVAAFAAWVALANGSPASAQALIPADPDWREDAAPAPPPLRTTGLIDLELRSALRFGIDPASVTLGPDGIVRYVVVAQNPAGGAVNGIYEGIHCGKAEARVYARYNPDSGWVKPPESDWRSLHDAPHSRYSLFIARNGVCYGHAANGTAQKIVRDLGAFHENRFR